MFKETTQSIPEEISPREKAARTTGRSLEFYKELLGEDPATFENKKILNIGAGSSDINRELQAQEIEPELFINLDLAYRKVGESQGLLNVVSGKKTERAELPETALAADMKKLPFADNSLDKVFCLWSVAWLPEDGKTTALAEAYRVAKAEGEISVYPVSLTKKSQEILDKHDFLSKKEPELKIYQLLTAAQENKNLLQKSKQFLANVDSLAVEGIHTLLQKLKHKDLVTLKIQKSAEIDPEKFETIIAELKAAGVEF